MWNHQLRYATGPWLNCTGNVYWSGLPPKIHLSSLQLICTKIQVYLRQQSGTIVLCLPRMSGLKQVSYLDMAHPCMWKHYHSGIFKSIRQESYSTEPDHPEAHTASSRDDTSPFSRLTLDSYLVHSFSLLYLQSQVLEDQLKDHSEIYSYVT